MFFCAGNVSKIGGKSVTKWSFRVWSGEAHHSWFQGREGRNEGKKEVGMMLFLSAPLSIVWREWAQNM